MPKKRFSAEQILILLRQIDVFISQGKGRDIPGEKRPIGELSQVSQTQKNGRQMAHIYNFID